MLYFLLFVLFCPASSLLVDDYIHSLYLDLNKTYHLSWKFNETHIEFHTDVKTLGYVALGLSKDGSLNNADVFIAGVSNNQSYSWNYYGDADSKLMKQEPSKWHLMYFNETEKKTTLTFSRELSGPDMVINITQNTMRVLWGYNKTDTVSDSFKPDGVKSLYLLQIKMPDTVMPNDTMELEFRMNNTSIPKKKTTYWCKSFPVPPLEESVHSIIMSPYIQEGNEGFVHHMLLYGCYKNSSTGKKIGVESKCYAANMPTDWKGCRAVVYAWAIGGSKLVLPEQTGISIGGEGDAIFYILEIHYDNPQEKEGVQDSSGITMTVTKTKRKYEAAFLELGYYVGSTFPQKIPPYANEFRYYGYCEACESMIKPEENAGWNEKGIKIIANFLHAHLAGRKIRIHHYRNGKKLDDISYDNNYDFNYQEMRILKNEITVLKNDILVVECIYDTSERNDFTYGGLSTSDEMCLGFLLYYPRIELTNCLSDVPYDKSIIKNDTMQFKDNEDAINKFEVLINGWEPKVKFTQKCVNSTSTVTLENRSFSVHNPDDPTTISPTTISPTTKKEENNSAAKCFLNTGILFIFILYWLI